MDQHLPTFDEIAGDHDLSRVGGKALSLARLAGAGFTVPPGFVITTALTEVLDPAAQGWPDETWGAIVARYRQLGLADHPVAVRSSAIDEDSETASFAGQHATVLEVTGEADFREAVRTCIASLNSESAVSYRQHSGGKQSEARMAVIVQRMVRAEVGGVAFSIDPITGEASRAVVEAVVGSGESLASGMQEGDRLVLSRPGLDVVEQYHPGTPVLHSHLARVVAQAAIQAEEAFGGPQDIEFAFDGDTLWMLQSRPVTVAGAPDASGGWVSEFDTPTSDADLWTSSNVQEVLPGLLTPLTMSIFGAHAHTAYTRGYQRLKLLSKDEWPNFVGLFYNRAFLNVGATRLIADRAFGSSGDAAEHRYLGGEQPGKPRKDNSLRNWKHRVLSVAPLFQMAVGIFKAADRIDRETTAWDRRMRSVDPATLSNPELETLRQELMNWSSNIFRVHLQASACAGAGFDIVAKSIEPILGARTEGRLPALFTGMGGVESAQIGLDLWSLSRIALERGMGDAVRAQDFDPTDPALPSEWRDAFAAFIARHGHRGLNEMEPAASTWRADPAPVVSVVRSYLDLPEEQSPVATLERQAHERKRLTRALERRMNPLKRPVFRWTLKQAQDYVALRERTKSIVVRAMRIGDLYLPECQRRLVDSRVVERPDDVFYITDSELTSFLTGRLEGDLKAHVSRRRREFERNRHIELPERFRGHPVPIQPDHSHHTGDILTGTPVSPGTVTGRARVILDPATDGSMQPGEVLVAPVTDAGWTPLFALASGLVVDMGSALSHGSTVAREYGLPAVVNVRRGTRSIRTGDLLTVNGSAGTVTILEDDGPAAD